MTLPSELILTQAETLGEGDSPSSEQNETAPFIPAILPDETVPSEVL